MQRFLVILICLGLSFGVFSQKKFLKLNGKIENAKTDEKIKLFEVKIVTSQGAVFTVPYKKGKYQFYLQPFEKYKVYFSAKGFQSKSYEIDASNVSKYYSTKNYISEVDILLFPATMENKDKQSPKIGVLLFNPEVEGFEWDLKYSEAEKFKNKVNNGDSLLLNQPPKLPNAISQVLIFNWDSVVPIKLNNKKGVQSKVFNDILGGMNYAQAVFYSNIENEPESVLRWNEFQKMSGSRLKMAHNFESLYENYSAYSSLADTAILIRLGEWMELTQLMLKTSLKHKQKSFYLNYLETFLIRMDKRAFTDAELSLMADLQQLVRPIKDYSSVCGLVASKTQNKKRLLELESIIQSKINSIVENFYL